MPLKKLRCFNSGTISSGSYWEKEFAPAEDWHIKRIYISDRSAQTLTDVLAYIKLGDKLITDDYAPASIFGADPLVALEVDRDVAKGTSIYVKITNNKTTDVNIDVCFELTE